MTTNDMAVALAERVEGLRVKCGTCAYYDVIGQDHWTYIPITDLTAWLDAAVAAGHDPRIEYHRKSRTWGAYIGIKDAASPTAVEAVIAAWCALEVKP